MLAEYDSMKKIDRLKRRSDFLCARHSGLKWVSPTVIVQFNDRQDHSDLIRYGITATKKLGNAVIRNRTKRRLREAARHILAEHGHKGMDYVLIGRDKTSQCKYDELIKDLRW